MSLEECLAFLAGAVPHELEAFCGDTVLREAALVQGCDAGHRLGFGPQARTLSGAGIPG